MSKSGLSLNSCELHELPNFRPAVPGGRLFRSSFIERLSVTGMQQLARTVNSVIDLRGHAQSLAAYNSSHVAKFFDQKLLAADGSPVADADQGATAGSEAECAGAESRKTRYSIDFAGSQLYWQRVLRLPVLQLLQFSWSAIAAKVTASSQHKANALRILAADSQLKDMYTDIADCCQTELATVLRLLADDKNLPCLLHCHLGKDRTGIVVMLLLWLLGSSRDFILQEYALTEKLTDCIREESQLSIAQYNLPSSFLESKPETIEHLMQHIERNYGGVFKYMQWIGLSDTEVQALKTNFSSDKETEIW